MFNFYFGVAFALVNFILFLTCYKWFGKAGLFAWIAAASILANLQVVKTIEMFGLVMTLGNVIYGTIYLATDLINEKYGEKEAKKAVWFGFFTLIMTTIIMQMVLVFQPHESDIFQPHLEAIFGFMPRLVIGSLAAYLISQYLDVKLFAKLKEKFSRPDQLWIRNNGSTMVSQLIDTFIFCTIAFAGVFSWDVWLQIFFTTYVIKFVVSAASTPFIYIARGFKHSEETQKPGV